MYKVLVEASAEKLEDRLNELSTQGFKVISHTTTLQESTEQRYLVHTVILLELPTYQGKEGE